MSNPSLVHRLAVRADLPALGVLMDEAIGELQRPFLSAEQIAASRAIMRPGTQLVDDGTDFVRRGIGRLILSLCKAAARAEEVASVELLATLAGEPLYRARGFLPIAQIIDTRG